MVTMQDLIDANEKYLEGRDARQEEAILQAANHFNTATRLALAEAEEGKTSFSYDMDSPGDDWDPVQDGLQVMLMDAGFSTLIDGSVTWFSWSDEEDLV